MVIGTKGLYAGNESMHVAGGLRQNVQHLHDFTISLTTTRCVCNLLMPNRSCKKEHEDPMQVWQGPISEPTGS
jgi:hypothetical protein